MSTIAHTYVGSTILYGLLFAYLPYTFVYEQWGKMSAAIITGIISYGLQNYTEQHMRVIWESNTTFDTWLAFLTRRKIDKDVLMAHESLSASYFFDAFQNISKLVGILLVLSINREIKLMSSVATIFGLFTVVNKVTVYLSDRFVKSKMSEFENKNKDFNSLIDNIYDSFNEISKYNNLTRIKLDMQSACTSIKTHALNYNNIRVTLNILTSLMYVFAFYTAVNANANKYSTQTYQLLIIYAVTVLYPSMKVWYDTQKCIHMKKCINIINSHNRIATSVLSPTCSDTSSLLSLGVPPAARGIPCEYVVKDVLISSKDQARHNFRISTSFPSNYTVKTDDSSQIKSIASVLIGKSNPYDGYIKYNGSKIQNNIEFYLNMRHIFPNSFKYLIRRNKSIADIIMDGADQNTTNLASIIEIARYVGLHKSILELKDAYSSKDFDTLSNVNQHLVCVVRSLAARPSILIIEDPAKMFGMGHENIVQLISTWCNTNTCGVIIIKS